VLAIGVGYGGTPWAAGVSPVTREIAPSSSSYPVLTAHAAIAARNPDGPVAEMLRNPRWRWNTADGRRACHAGGMRYDVIWRMPSCRKARHSGTATRPSSCSSAPAAGPAVRAVGAVERVVATFASVSARLCADAGAVLIGSDSPIPFTIPRHWHDAFAEPAVLANLHRGNRGLLGLRHMLPTRRWSGSRARRGPRRRCRCDFPRDESTQQRRRLHWRLRLPEDLRALEVS
jgi:hypothetical protein